MKKVKVLSYAVLPLLIATGLSACGGGSSSSTTGTGGSNPVSPITVQTKLSFDDMTSIPVLNGSPTAGKFYIRNYSNKDISNVSINLSTKKGARSQAAKLLASTLNAGDVMDSNGFKILNASACTTIKANSFCALDIVTPSLSAGNAGSATINISYTDTTGAKQNTSQLINYRYLDSSAVKNVSFAPGSVRAIGAPGSSRHVVGYLVGGGKAGTVYDNVSLTPNLPGQIKIANGFVNGTQVAAGQVIPVELVASVSSSTPLGLTVTPVAGGTVIASQASRLQAAKSQKAKSVNSKSLMSDDGGNLGDPLTVNVVPGQNVPNLIFANLPVLNLGTGTESSVTVDVTNNGSGPASALAINSSDSHVTVGTNSCSSGLNPGANCSFTLNVSAEASGSSSITYTSGSDVSGDVLYWVNGDVYPRLTMTPSASDMVLGVNRIGSSGYNVIYTVANTGTSDMSHVAFTATDNGGALTLINPLVSDCTVDPVNGSPYYKLVAGGAACHVTSAFDTSLSTSLGAQTYLTAIGNAADNTASSTQYKFVSLPVTYHVYNAPSLIISPTTESNITLSILANGVSNTSQVYTITNSGTVTADIGTITVDSVVTTTHQPSISGQTCGSTLAAGADCTITVSYGPVGSDVGANENGSMQVDVPYSGGTPTVTGSVLSQFNYSLIGNDSWVSLGAAASGGLSGSPYAATGSGAATETLTLTYTNNSANRSLSGFNVNTNALPRGLTVSGGTCPTGSTTGSLSSGATCTVQLTLNKSDLANVGSGTPINSGSVINYPAASWQTDFGFYSESQVPDSNNATGFYMNYTQASIVASLINNNTSSIGLSLVAVNATGYSPLTVSVSDVSGSLSNAPSVSGVCTISSNMALSCPFSAGNLTGGATYTMPSYLVSGDTASVLLNLSVNAGSGFASLSPTTLVMSYTKP